MTCQLSHTQIEDGMKVVLFFIEKINNTRSLRYGNTDTGKLLSLPLFATYNDYGQFTLDPEKESENKITIEALSKAANGVDLRFSLDSDLDPELFEFMKHQTYIESDEFKALFKNISLDNYAEIFENINNNDDSSFAYMVFNAETYNTIVNDTLNNTFEYYDSKSKKMVETSTYLNDALAFYQSINIGDTQMNMNYDRVLPDDTFELSFIQPSKSKAQRFFYMHLEDSIKENPQSIKHFIGANIFAQALKKLAVPIQQAMIGGQIAPVKFYALKLKAEAKLLKESFASDIDYDFISYDLVANIVPGFASAVSENDFHNKDPHIITNKLTLENIMDIYAAIPSSNSLY